MRKQVVGIGTKPCGGKPTVGCKKHTLMWEEACERVSAKREAKPLSGKRVREVLTDCNVLEEAEAVCKENAVTFDDIGSLSRMKAPSMARFMVWRLMWERGLSFPHIAKVWGNRDHTTILSGVRKAFRTRVRVAA